MVVFPIKGDFFSLKKLYLHLKQVKLFLLIQEPSAVFYRKN